MRRFQPNTTPPQGFAKKHFDLPIYAAQFHGRQPLDSGQNLGANAHQECASPQPPAFIGIAGHDLTVQRAGVDHGLGLAIRAEHDQKV